MTGNGDQVPAGVGRTAIGMARVRAEETRRADRLFDDPYAQAFINAAPGALAEEQASGQLAAWGAAISFQGVIRTRFFDDYLLGACQAGCRQVVLLAARLDSRAFRLPWPAGVRLFELDLPQVLAFKEHVPASNAAVPRCQRTLVAADLRQDWPAALMAAGMEPAEPTAWLAGGCSSTCPPPTRTACWPAYPERGRNAGWASSALAQYSQAVRLRKDRADGRTRQEAGGG